jgi:hypothetical protein
MDRLQFLNLQFQNPPLVLLAAGWTSEGHKVDRFGKTFANASCAQSRAIGMGITEPLQPAGRLCFSVAHSPGQKTVGLAAMLCRKIQPAFAALGITGVGWLTFRQTVGTMLAGMGEHQLTIRDYLRHANLTVTNKYLQGTAKSKRCVQDKRVEAILPGGILGKEGCQLWSSKAIGP